MPKILAKELLARASMAALAGLLTALPARAEDLADRVKVLEARLAASLQTIERLSARVNELERQRSVPAAPASAAGPVAAAASAPPSGDEQARALTALAASVNQISEGLSKRDTEGGLPLHGFADVGAGWSSSQDPRRLRGFNAGSLDIYLTPQLGDRIKALFEVVFEHLPGEDTTVDVERLQIGYTVSDSLTLWMGRFHNPIGLWNTLYHHGANLQTSIARPRFIDFEDKGGIVPTHSTGIWASGKTATSIGRVTYDLYMGNGPTIRNRGLDINPVSDDTDNKLLGLNLGLHPNGASRGWALGVHALGSTVNARSTAGTVMSTTRLRMAGAYAEFDSETWNVLGEYYNQRNRDVSTALSHSNNLWFVQASRNYGSLTPYLRFERANLDPADDYFRSLLIGRAYRRVLVGLRYDLDTRSAIKTEFSDTRESAVLQIDASGAVMPFSAARYRGVAVEYSIAF